MPLLAHAAPNATGQNDMSKTGRAKQIFKPEFQFGLGGVRLGNEFEVVTNEDAMKTLEASGTPASATSMCRPGMA
jgi:D-threo-aldose 1-dehydrogenase